MLSVAPLFAQGARGPMSGGGIMSPPVNQRPIGLEFVGIEQHLNAEVPVDLEFKDELGNPVKLADYFGHGRPVILNLGYYQCPMLCSELLQGLVGSMKALTFDLGKDFYVVTVSFDPRETTEMAAAKKRDIMKRYGRANADQGWHFLTGKADRSMRSPNRSASNISSIRKPSSTPTPPRSLCSRPTTTFRDTFMESSSLPRICASDWCRPRKTELVTSATRCSSTAITTIPGLENTAPSSATS
jgi:hypothetical protein